MHIPYRLITNDQGQTLILHIKQMTNEDQAAEQEKQFTEKNLPIYEKIEKETPADFRMEIKYADDFANWKRDATQELTGFKTKLSDIHFDEER